MGWAMLQIMQLLIFLQDVNRQVGSCPSTPQFSHLFYEMLADRYGLLHQLLEMLEPIYTPKSRAQKKASYSNGTFS
jgi:hypothetical protein